MNVHSVCVPISDVPRLRKGFVNFIGGFFALQHKESVPDRILASARRLFSERGFHRTAMADLAGDAQVSVGAIYRAFSSKSEIIQAIVRSDTEQTLLELEAGIREVGEGAVPPALAVERLVFQWISKRDDALNHEIVAEGHRNPEVAETIYGVCGQFREQFRTLARLLQPRLDASELEGAAELLLACLFGMGNRQFTQPRLNAVETAAATTRLILKALE